MVPIALKRKIKFKNEVFRAYINADNMEEAIKELNRLGHPGYQNIKIDAQAYREDENLVPLSSDDSSCDSGDDVPKDASGTDKQGTNTQEAEEEEDSIKKHQHQ